MSDDIDIEPVRSFIINDQFTEVLRGLTEERFAGIIVYAFSEVFGLDWSVPEDAIDRAVAEAIAKFADKFQAGRKEAKSASQRAKEYRARKAEKMQNRHETNETNGANVTRTDANADRTANAEGKKERKKEGVRCDAHPPAPAPAPYDFPSVDRIVSYAQVHFPPPVPPDDFCAYFHQRMTECAWIDKNGRSLANGRWQRELSAWWDQEKKNNFARALTSEPQQVTGSGRPNDRDVTREDVWRVD